MYIHRIHEIDNDMNGLVVSKVRLEDSRGG